MLEVVAKAPDRPGVYRQVLRITTSSSAQPTVKLPVILSVSRGGFATPGRLDFGRFDRGQTVSRDVRVTLPEGASLKAAVPHPMVLDVKIGPADGKGSVAVAMRPKENIPFGPIAGELRVHLAGKETGLLIVPFVGYVSEAERLETDTLVADGRR